MTDQPKRTPRTYNITKNGLRYLNEEEMLNPHMQDEHILADYREWCWMKRIGKQ